MKTRRYLVRGLWANGRGKYNTEETERFPVPATFDTDLKAIAAAIEYGFGEGAIREYDVELLNIGGLIQ